MLFICYRYVDDSELGVDTAISTPSPSQLSPLSDFALASNSSLLCRLVGVHVWERANSVHVKNSKLGHVRYIFVHLFDSRIAGPHYHKRQKALIQHDR